MVVRALTDYVIALDGADWATALAPWQDTLPQNFTLWLVNKFGDPFIVDGNGAVHWLPLDQGALVSVAASRDNFASLVDQGSNFNEWFLAPLVDQLSGLGVHPTAGRCYGFVTPPVMGGAYTPENVSTPWLPEYYRLTAQFFRQVAGLPDGTWVRVVPPKSGPR